MYMRSMTRKRIGYCKGRGFFSRVDILHHAHSSVSASSLEWLGLSSRVGAAHGDRQDQYRYCGRYPYYRM